MLSSEWSPYLALLTLSINEFNQSDVYTISSSNIKETILTINIEFKKDNDFIILNKELLV